MQPVEGFFLNGIFMWSLVFSFSSLVFRIRVKVSPK